MMYAVDLDRLCAGQCMNSYRRKVRTHQAAIIAHQQAYAEWLTEADAWHPPLPYPVEPEPPVEPRLPYPVFGEPVYCPSCVYEIKAMLSKLDGAACMYLREADGFRGESEQAKVSGSSTPASLSPAVEDIDDLDLWLRSWKGAYLGRDTFARSGGLADSVALGTAWLVARAERILAHPDLAKDFGEEVAGWYRRLRRYDPSEIVVERLRGVRCPACGGLTLERKVGDDKVTCRMMTCERVLKLSEYRELADEARKARKAC